MKPSATANTNHMEVFNFKGHTYFAYYDGSLPHGNGYRRVACVEEFKVNDDGTIPYIKKTAIGLTGTINQITDIKGNYINIEPFENTLNDTDYPMVDKPILVDNNNGKNQNAKLILENLINFKDTYASIESNCKPGMYLTVGNKLNDEVYDVVLSQDVNETPAEANSMTFRTLLGFIGEGVTF